MTDTAPPIGSSATTGRVATAAEIDRMTMPERLAFVRDLRDGIATRLGAGQRWRNIEGVLIFFDEAAMGAPGSWVSHVNAGVLETIGIGLSVAAGETSGEGLTTAQLAWVPYLDRLRAGDLDTPTAHDRAWADAKALCTDHGVALAERHGVVPSDAEQRFLLFARVYNWGLANRAVVDLAITYAPTLDARLSGVVTSEFVDRVMNVGDSDAIRRCCWLVHTVAEIEPTPELIGAARLMIPGLGALLGATPRSS